MVEPFTSVIPGLGLTFAKDLEDRLREELTRSGLDGVISLAEDGHEPGPRDVRISDGHVAAFSADDVTETTEIRRLSRWGPVTDGGPEAPPESRYSQSLVEYAIHVRCRERIAHVRVSCDAVLSERRIPIRINEFIPRAFIQETVHPFNDTRVIKTQRAAAEAQLRPEDPEPELKNERVWTPGEMLDWVRRDVQELAVALVMLQLNAEPAALVARAGKLDSGDPAAALDAWGVAFEALRRRDPDPDHTGETLTRSDLTDALRSALERRRLQDRELAELKTAAQAGMTRAVARLLSAERERRQGPKP
jgi:hypothetical protein